MQNAVNVTIFEGKLPRYSSLYINSDWFIDTEYVTLKFDEDCLTIIKHYLDVPKTAVTVSRNKIGVRLFYRGVLPKGKFQSDPEDSNEDELVIYFDEID